MREWVVSVFAVFCACWCFAQEVFVPFPRGDYYRTLNFGEAIVEAVKTPSSADMVRETFIVRYAPKSIKCDADILARVKKYEQTPNMKYRDLGWLFETYVKNRYETLYYVAKSTAPLNDLTGKLQDGRFTNAQLKAHKSGDPKKYFKDMLKGYNALFVIPDDHVAPLKNYLKNLARERDYLATLKDSSTISDEQKKRLSILKKYNIESKIHRVKGGGISYKNLENLFDEGVREIKSQSKNL